MDRVDEYRDILYKILDQHNRIPYLQKEVESKLIVDSDRNNFVMMVVGWDGDRRVHGVVVHIEMINGKIWIHRDGIEDGITDELVAAGVPKDKIVLAFHSPDVRQYTGYAIA
ncbi:MAG: XisI protein [Cyanobacteriota bacterium]|nr:XisI protein [Cyanobacteriota bacterium]